MPVTRRAWDDPPMAMTSAPVTARRPLRSMAAVRRDGGRGRARRRHRRGRAGADGVHVAGQPGIGDGRALRDCRRCASTPTRMRSMPAGNASPRRGSTVDVNSDPGTPDKYTTLELTWNETRRRDAPEHVLRLRRSRLVGERDPHVQRQGARRLDRLHGHLLPHAARPRLHRRRRPRRDRRPRTPGHLESAAAGRSSRPPACASTRRRSTRSMSPYATRRHAEGRGRLRARDHDAARHRDVLRGATRSAFSFDWTIANPGGREARDVRRQARCVPTCSARIRRSRSNLAPASPGTTTLHVVARRRANGQVVATADIPVTVG